MKLYGSLAVELRFIVCINDTNIDTIAAQLRRVL